MTNQQRKGQTGEPTTNKAHFGSKTYGPPDLSLAPPAPTVTTESAPAAPRPNYTRIPTRTLQGSYRNMRDLERQREEAVAAVAAIDRARGEAALEQMQLYVKAEFPGAALIHINNSGFTPEVHTIEHENGGVFDLDRGSRQAKKLAELTSLLGASRDMGRYNLEPDGASYGGMQLRYLLNVPRD